MSRSNSDAPRITEKQNWFFGTQPIFMRYSIIHNKRLLLDKFKEPVKLVQRIVLSQTGCRTSNGNGRWRARRHSTDSAATGTRTTVDSQVYICYACLNLSISPLMVRCWCLISCIMRLLARRLIKLSALSEVLLCDGKRVVPFATQPKWRLLISRMASSSMFQRNVEKAVFSFPYERYSDRLKRRIIFTMCCHTSRLLRTDVSFATWHNFFS